MSNNNLSASGAAQPNPRLPKIMGVLNITPDSFSDGGQFTSRESALAHAEHLIAQGASVIDVGGESTRPGATRLTPVQEQARVLPVIEALADLPAVADGSVAISVDTMNASTAKAAFERGARIINDVSGGQADPEMLETVAGLIADGGFGACTYVLGHWANFEAGAGAVQIADDIVSTVVDELAERIRVADDAGLSRGRLVLDPGLGFGKDSDQNWQLVEDFEALASLGLPILIGASRKRFLAARVAEVSGIDFASVTLRQRDEATAALTAQIFAQALEGGSADLLWGFRVHNVEPNLDALRSVAALRFAH